MMRMAPADVLDTLLLVKGQGKVEQQWSVTDVTIKAPVPGAQSRQSHIKVST
jgi:hypothetical protein